MFNRSLLVAVSMAALLSAPAFACDMHKAKAHEHHNAVKASPELRRNSPAVNNYIIANKTMHAGMMIPYTGDPDIDFVAGMIPHHQGAVDMAEVQLKFGRDEELKKLARAIILMQTDEIAMMSSWLRGRKGHILPDAEYRPTTIGFKEAMDKMHADMNIEFTGDADRDFVLGMIPHHQGAVDMAAVYKPHGKYQHLQDLATNIISTQLQEIRVMEEWLAKNPASEVKKQKKKRKNVKKNGQHAHH